MARTAPALTERKRWEGKVCEMRELLSRYCQEESFALTKRAGIEPRCVTNNNYIELRTAIYMNLPRHEVNSAVYSLTTILALAELVGYPS